MEEIEGDKEMTDRTQLCKEFAELTGGQWHELVSSSKYGNPVCSCGKVITLPEFIHFTINNCRYENPADVLRVMMARDDWYILDWAKPSGFVWNIGEPILCGQYAVGYNINSRYILEPDALMKAAVEFLKEGKK